MLRKSRFAPALRGGAFRVRSCMLLSCALVALSGCGPVLYESRIRAAEAKLVEAREANARWYAPYEYYYAEAHLRQARIEAAEASYEDALSYAETAEEYGTRALRVTSTRRRAER
jgi:hypothetical protein